MTETAVKISQIKKIYPTAAELSSVNNNLHCHEEGCNQIFTSGSNLLMHVQKTHKKEKLLKNNDECIYHHHCPESNCIYHEIRHFKKMKYLKQHYLKIHANKNFICDFCKKGFATLTSKNSHSEVCSVEFTCSDCKMKYTSYESLLKHGRRKNHMIAPRSSFIRNFSSNDLLKKCNSELLADKVAIPKRSISMQTIKIVPVLLQVVKNDSMIDREIQTEPIEIKGKAIKRRSNIFTQTCPRRKVRRSAETQTIGDCILKKAIQDAKLKESDSSEKLSIRKCIETQTKDAFWFEKGAGEHCSTQTTVELESKESSISLDTINSEDLIHSSSQTSVNSLNYFEEFGNCQETQTDIFQDDFLDSSFNLANIQTQTNAELDLCSNMYTQTCEDQLLSDFGFSNIQTQTTWPDYDLFVSAETQTLLTQNTKGIFDMSNHPLNSSIREISHMETQTDMEFRQLLEEINA